MMLELIKTVIADSFRLLAGLIPLVFLGLYFASLAYRIPGIRKIGIVTRPLCTLSRLPICCSVYFTVCLVNLPAAVMTLVKFRKSGMIDDNSVVVASLVAGVPVMLYIALFFACPVALPVLGLSAGLLYVCCFVGCGALQTLMGIVMGRSLLKKGPLLEIWQDKEEECLPFKKILVKALFEGLAGLKSVMVILVPITFLVFLLANSGIMAQTERLARPLTEVVGLPEAATQLIATSAINIVAAYGIGGILLSDGILTGTDVAISLMCGAFLFNIIELWHTLIPFNVSFFGVRLGIRTGFCVFAAIGLSELSIIALLTAINQ